MIILTPTQKRIYDTVLENPGINHVEATRLLGAKEHSGYQHCLDTLRKGAITTDLTDGRVMGRLFPAVDIKITISGKDAFRMVKDLKRMKKRDAITSQHRATIFTNGAQADCELDFGCDEGSIL